MVFLVKGTGTWVNHLYKQHETYQTKIRPQAQLLHFNKDVNSNHPPPPPPPYQKDVNSNQIFKTYGTYGGQRRSEYKTLGIMMTNKYTFLGVNCQFGGLNSVFRILQLKTPKILCGKQVRSEDTHLLVPDSYL